MKLIQGDCLEEMRKLAEEDVQIDLILTDPPYNTIKNIALKGWDNNTTKWDNEIPMYDMFKCCEELLRMNGTLILFSQEPYTSRLRTYGYPNLSFIYPLYWLKDHFANNLLVNKAPVNFVENLSVFRKDYDSKLLNPLREYSAYLLENIGAKKDIMEKIGGKADHFFRCNSNQFALCTEETYNELIYYYSIDKLDGFKSYDELVEINSKFNSKFNSKSKYKSNVFQYKRPYNGFHPTEKPVDLLKDLILTYTDNGDLVLDFTMGSGSTGVACLQTNRKFIGIELDENYYNIAKQRINEANEQKKISLGENDG